MKLSNPQRIMLLALSLLGLTLELFGVNNGCYHYGAYPLKFFGVPISIPLGWAIVCGLAYIISVKYGVFIGVLTAYTIDLILEPIAFYGGLWTWTNTATAKIYFNSTLGNVIVWLIMLSLSVIMLSKVKQK